MRKREYAVIARYALARSEIARSARFQPPPTRGSASSHLPQLRWGRTLERGRGSSPEASFRAQRFGAAGTRVARRCVLPRQRRGRWPEPAGSGRRGRARLGGGMCSRAAAVPSVFEACASSQLPQLRWGRTLWTSRSVFPQYVVRGTQFAPDGIHNALVTLRAAVMDLSVGGWVADRRGTTWAVFQLSSGTSSEVPFPPTPPQSGRPRQSEIEPPVHRGVRLVRPPTLVHRVGGQ